MKSVQAKVIFAIFAALLTIVAASCDNSVHPNYSASGPSTSVPLCPPTATVADTIVVDVEDLTPDQIKEQINLAKSLIRQEIFDQIVTAGYFKYTTVTMPNGQLRITGALTVVTGSGGFIEP